MDCFKIQAETLQYLRKQQQTFNAIIKTLDTITQLNQPILNLFPQSIQTTQTSMKSQKQCKTQNNRKCTKFDLGVSEKYGYQSKCSQDNKYKQAQSEVDSSLYYQFQQALALRGKTKQEKYLAFLNVAYFYFKISNTKINKKIDLNPQKTQKQQQIKKILKPQLFKQFQAQLDDDNFEQQFENYLKAYTNNISNQSNIPILIKFCYRLQEINRAIWQTRDFIKIRDYCILLKDNILDDMKKQSNKQMQRQEFIEHEHKKISDLQQIQSRKQQLTKHHIRQASTSKPKSKPPIETARAQSASFLPQAQRKQAKSRTMRTTISLLSGMNHLKNLNADWLSRFERIPYLQNYYKVFIWRLDSCIILINQILHKEAYTRQNLMGYLKMGQWMREQYMNSNTVAPTPKTASSTNKLASKSNNNSNLSETHKTILKQMLVAYSGIIKHAHKLKQCKHYDMLTLQLHICLKRMQKILKKQAKASQMNLQSDNQLLHNIITNHLITKNTRRYNRYGRNAQNIQQQNQHKNAIHQHKNNVTTNQQKHISFKDIIDDNTSSEGQKQDKNNQNPNFISIDYEFINKQLNQAIKNQELSTYENYFNQNVQTLKQEQARQIYKQSQRKQMFNKTIDYIMHKKSNSMANDSQLFSGKYHINLKKKFQQMKNRDENDHKKKQTKTSHQSQQNIASKRLLTEFNRRNQTRQMSTHRMNADGSKLPFFNRSGRKQKTTYISMTKRNTKSGLLLSEVKDSQNLYNAILSTQKRAMVITNKILEDQIAYIHNIQNQKPTPTFEQIFMISSKSNGRQNSKADKQESYSFRGIGMGVANSSAGSIANPSWIDNNSIQELKITMINCFGYQIGFVTLHIFKNAGNDEISIQFYSQLHKLFSDKITILNRPNLQIQNAKQSDKQKDKNKQRQKKQKRKQKKSKEDKNENNNHILHKDIFSFEELKRQISTSEFYFELIQQAIEKNIENADINIIQQHLQKQKQDRKQLSLSSQTKQNQSSNPSDKQSSSFVGTVRKSKEKREHSMKKQSFMFLCMNRMSHSLIYWYYTRGSKINGNILLKRQIPQISDSLKFAIALDFMKKYNHKQCLDKLSHVRNKKALFECFKYLFYGRKILVKGLIMRKNNFMFYVLSLEHFSEKNFQIKTKEQGKSQFRDLQFTLSIYSKYNNNWNVVQSFKYPVQKVLSPEKITLFMLSNLIQSEISSQYLQALAMDIYLKQSDPRQSSQDEFRQKNYNIVEQNSTSDKDMVIKITPSNHQFKTDSTISHYINIILWYIEIIGFPVNLNVEHTYKKVLRIQNSLFSFEEFHLGCGLIFQIVRNIKNKGKIHQIAIFQPKDRKKIRQNDKKEVTKYNASLKEQSCKSSVCKQKEKQVKLFSEDVINKDVQSKYKKRPSKFSACSNISQNSLHKFQANSNYVISSIVDSHNSLRNFPNKNLSRIEQQSLYQKKLNYECDPIFKMSKSVYHNRLVLSSPCEKNRKLVNKIKKSIIQKQQMDIVQVIYKKVMKVKGIYVYVCLSYNKMISAYRFDLYEVINSKRFAGYFRLHQYGISIKQQTKQNENKQEMLDGSDYDQWQKNTSIYKKIKSSVSKEYYRSYYDYNINSQKFNTAKYTQSVCKRYTNYNYNLAEKNSVSLQHNNMTNSSKIIEHFKIFQNSSKKEQKMHEIIKNLFKNNMVLLSDNLMQAQIMVGQTENLVLNNVHKCDSLRIPMFEIYNNLSTFQGKNKGKIELIQINSKFFLLILLQNDPNIYYSVVDDNPFMNNINLFADFPAKEHPINLYSDLFMRMYMKFLGNNLTILQLREMKDIFLL